MIDVNSSFATRKESRIAKKNACSHSRICAPARPVIAFIDHTATLGGGEIALLNLVQTIDRSLFAPFVILGTDGPLVERLRACDVEVHVLPLSPSLLHTRKDSLGMSSFSRVKDMARLLVYIRNLAAFLRTRRVHLVHTNSLKADIIGGSAARMAGIPVIWHIRDRIEDDYLPKIVVRLFRALCLIIPNYVIANSRATLQTLTLPTERKRQSTWIYNGLSVQNNARIIHDGVPEQDTALPSRKPDGKTRIGLVGRISPWKGQHIFLRAAKLVHVRFPETRFEIIGAALFSESDYEQEIRALAVSLELEDCVEFTGFCDPISTRIAALDILVHASTTGEPFGQVIIEGMALGKPVVATNGGGVPEIIEDGLSGLLVPMGDVEAMAAAIVCLMEQPDMAAKMGREAHCRVAQHFTIDLTAGRIEAVYDELLAVAQ